MRMWFDIESREIVTETELQAEYMQDMEDGIYDCPISFDDYIIDCEIQSNGTLIEIDNAYLFQHI